MPYDADEIRAKSYDVFVSYKREDDDARATLVSALETVGFDVFWDAKLNHGDWKGELRDEINRSKMVICLWSAKAAASENVKAEAFHAFGIKKLLSVHIEDRSVVPAYFNSTNLHPFDGWADDSRSEAQIAKILATLERFIGAPGRKTNEARIASVIPVEWGDIPGAPPRLVGRDDEMAMLEAAWESGAPGKVNAVVLHALGGAGKSAVLRTFANGLLIAGGCGASRIYGWSAYSQGSGEQKRADADSFISKALDDLGFQGRRPSDPVERARELAKLIQRERTALLLDGLEPLQDPPAVNGGRFKDRGFAELVRILASQNPGLMVLTTRQEIPELEGRGALVVNHALDRLGEPAGADLLVELGVRGRQRELEKAVRELDGHALSVTLLGAYLSEVCGGDIRHSDQFDFANIVLTQAEEEELATDKTVKPAKRAAKIMLGYLERFDKLAADGAGAGRGGAERALLHLLGLFDRPADGRAVEALLEKRIPGLTDELFLDSVTKISGWWPFKSRKVEMREVTPDDRGRRIRRAKESLRKLRLLSKPNPDDPQELDAHPIVRAFFSGRLRALAPVPAKAAHEILYQHYSTATAAFPATLEAMQPLFHAVRHGVEADRVEDAFHDVFLRRILRGNDEYLLTALGAVGPYLTVLGHFFDVPWRTPRSALAQANQSWLKGMAAYLLKTLGRLKDAIEPRRSSVGHYVELGYWDEAANLANSLCQELLILGDIAGSIEAGAKSMEYSELGSDPIVRCYCLSDYSYAQSQYGTAVAIHDIFAQIEDLYGGKVHGFTAYKQEDLLLGSGDSSLSRGVVGQQIPPQTRLLDRAFDVLRIARAQDALADPDAAVTLDAAVVEFRTAGAMHHLPKALLARVAHRRRRATLGETELVEKIREDFFEIEEVAGDEMGLYLADLALERARLALDVPSAFASPQAARTEAEAQVARAAELITETGYHRRDHELAELQYRLAAPASM